MTVVGVGQCPDRKDGLGHVFKSWQVDPRRSCEFCGRPGRDNVFQGESGGYFAEATGQRAETFSRMPAPMESGTGKVEKAWPKGMPPGLVTAASLVTEDKKRRDAEAVANGTARPGQIAGARRGKAA